MADPVIHLSGISRYPVKSMGGEMLPTVALDGLGIAGDRRFAVRDLDTGKIVSAKRPAVGRVLLNCGARTEGDAVYVRVGDHEVPAAEIDTVDTLLSAELGIRAHLDHATTADEVYESYWPEIEGLAMSDVTVDLPIALSTEKGTFVDLAALHLVTTSSLRHLQRLAPESAIDVARFRPSLLLDLDDDVDGFVENGWVERPARLGSAVLAIGSASPRCVMTTLAQGDLAEDRSVLRTLADHNRLEVGGFGDFACLGVYAEVTEPGEVRVGDQLRFL